MEEIKYNKNIIDRKYTKTLTPKEKEKLIEEFKEDCERCLKESEAFIYTMVLWDSKEVESLFINNTMLRSLLKLFDMGIKIPVKGLYNDIEKQYTESLSKLRDKYRGKINGEFLDTIYWGLMSIANKGLLKHTFDSDKDEYNLIKIMEANKVYSQWELKFLTSNAPIENRLDLYKEILTTYSAQDLIVDPEEIRDEDEKKKFIELNEKINNDESELWHIFFEMLADKPMSIITLQNSGLLDFNKAKSEEDVVPIEFIRNDFDNIPYPIIITRLDLWIALTKNEKSDLKNIRLYDLIMEELIMYPDYIRYLLSNVDFKASREYGIRLCDGILAHKKKIEKEYAFYDYMVKILSELEDKVEKTKGKTKKEKAIECEDGFKSRYVRYICEREMYKKKLEEGRRAVSTLLHNLSEKVETLPVDRNKLLIEQLDFKK